MGPGGNRGFRKNLKHATSKNNWAAANGGVTNGGLRGV